MEGLGGFTAQPWWVGWRLEWPLKEICEKEKTCINEEVDQEVLDFLLKFKKNFEHQNLKNILSHKPSRQVRMWHQVWEAMDQDFCKFPNGPWYSTVGVPVDIVVNKIFQNFQRSQRLVSIEKIPFQKDKWNNQNEILKYHNSGGVSTMLVFGKTHMLSLSSGEKEKKNNCLAKAKVYWQSIEPESDFVVLPVVMI